MRPAQLAAVCVLLVGCKAADARTDTIAANGQSITVISSADLSRIGDELSRGGSSGRVFLEQPGVQVVESRRVVNGTPEVHDNWMDATFVQVGRATFRAGGSVSGAMLSSPGEHRGGTMSGATERPLAAGDFVLVPAGVPHQFLVARGDSVRYITIKVPRVRP
jgi:mannose-6-phosphate isomerase-like protein (cupin superfamily)